MAHEFFSKLFSSDFMPHGHCYFWRPEILWLHVGSDIAIFLAYYSIPAALLYFIKKRKDIRFNSILILFAAFIFACGTTHIIDVWTVWHGTYRFQGVVKFLTALISVITAIVLWPLIPKALSLPTLEKLEQEIERRKRAEEQLIERKENLETEVAKQTKNLEKTIEDLEAFNRLAVDREEQMIVLKKRINQLCVELGKSPEYKLV